MDLRSFIPLSAFLLISGIFCTPKVSYSQDKGALLPDINPKDIEIRGKFNARFPGLSRQPILGFDPNLQVYQIDPNRTPFMESGDQMVANLPVSSLSRPAPPAYTGLNYASNISTYTNLGVGSYTSPIVKFWGAYPIDKGSYVGGNLDLSSSDGHLDNQPSSFRFLTANGEYGMQLNQKMELKLHGGVQNDFNHSVEFAGQNTNVSDARIEYEGFNGGAELSRFTNEIAGWKLRGNIRSFKTSFKDHPLGGTINEVAYDGSFANRWALGKPNETFTLKAGVRGGDYNPENLESQRWATFRAGIVYQALFDYRTALYAEADAFYTSDIKQDKAYPGGLLKIDHWFGDRLKITGKVEGKPQVNTVEQLHEHNRFLGYDNDLIHTYTVDVTGQASIKYYRGSTLHGGVTYSNMTDYPYFLPASRTNNSGSSRLDLFTVNYDNATNFKLFAGITHQLLPERFWVSAEAYVQHPELTNGRKIPFEESWGTKASISIRPIDQFTVKGWMHYVARRNTTITTNRKVDGFLLVGGQADVDITRNFGAYVKLVNALGEKYQVWNGYQERPFQVYGGLTLKF